MRRGFITRFSCWSICYLQKDSTSSPITSTLKTSRNTFVLSPKVFLNRDQLRNYLGICSKLLNHTDMAQRSILVKLMKMSHLRLLLMRKHLSCQLLILTFLLNVWRSWKCTGLPGLILEYRSSS